MGWFSTLKIKKQFVFRQEMCNMGFYINPCADELLVSRLVFIHLKLELLTQIANAISCFKWK